MKLLHDDINAGKLKPVYLFFGDEAWLMDEALQALIHAVAPSGGEWGVEILDGGTAGPQTAAAAAMEGSLFGGSRLVIVKNINWLETAGKSTGHKGEDKDTTAPLLAYLELPNPNTCLALTLRGSVDKRRKLAQAIQKKGRLIECVTPKGGERDTWLANRFKASGIKADRRAIAHISVSCANLSQMAAEADKLMLYCGDKGEITLKDALALVSESSLLTVFELTDAAAAKDAAKACACYRRLLRQGEEEQKIFALLAAQFRNMLLTQDLQTRGAKPAEIAKELGLHPYVAEKCAKANRTFSRRQLIKTLEMLLAADIAQKSGKGDMEDLLETVILRICSARS
ncbi:MAG: DNA polymerase III subunit delta [Clostridiales bacterium]|nr:DNA polymerase III subunit delta [Clostridiales bacterium]